MTQSQNLRHCRAAAAQRRAPVPEPQMFDPTAVFGLTRTRGSGGFTNVSPFPTDTTTDNSVPSTISQPSSVVSSSSTTSSATPSTTSTSIVVSSTTTPPSPPTTSTTPTTAVVTVSVSHTSSSTTSSASATSTAEPSSGVSTGAVVGGIGAGIVAVAAIGFAIIFFLRRSRKRDNNTHAFRRSAILLDDPPTHDDTVSRGFNPRPPTMIERHLASPAPTFSTQYGHPPPAYNECTGEHARTGAGHGASNYQSPPPGQDISMNNGAPSPISATSTLPMYTDPAYGQSPFSPAGQYAGQEYNEQSQPSVGVAAKGGPGC